MMEKIKQKSKKDKSGKNTDKDKSSLFMSDVKSLKENLKIREILRTVKMNSSMRLKAPRGSKVMQNKDFNDNDELFDETTSNASQDSFESPSALNPVMMLHNSNSDSHEPGHVSDTSEDNAHNHSKTNDEGESRSNDEISTPVTDSSLHDNEIHKLPSHNHLSSETENSPVTTDMPQTPILKPQQRHRKLSLDQTMLSRSESLSQSNVDLHSVGKSPLERKSSFFRKKMDSFLKNTTEIFKRQSFQSKSQGISRRGSMSVSLQSLNGRASFNGDITEEAVEKHGEEQGSVTSLQSSLTAEHSASSLSVSQSDRMAQDAQFEDDRVGSSPALVASQPLGDVSSNSVNSLNEALIQEAMLNRAISMSSGLDSATGKGRRKASRSNRLTWVASEGITNYFRRLSQGEKNREMQCCHSYQDFSTIPENNLCGPKTDSKGRRLSYQRAVSGEDPLPPSRYHDSSLRRKALIPENSEADYELVQLLAEYSRTGVPPLRGLCIAPISDRAFAYLYWSERIENLIEYYDQKKAALSKTEGLRQTAIRELISTEVDYIRHLVAIVEIFMATAHALQDRGKILQLDTEKLFNNVPDVLNANLYFWEQALVPMVADAVERCLPFNTDLMSGGFCRFREIFTPYEKYVSNQNKALEYLKSLSNNVDFAEYLSWCHNNKSCNRLLLSDFLAKPMQRLTKYSLLLRRVINHTELEPERTVLMAMEAFAKNYVHDLNRTIRQREELEMIDHLSNIIDTFEIDFKDEELERCFRSCSNLNLKAPMLNCLPGHARSLIFQGDLRFRDSGKEQEVRAFLLTDMLLICKKVSKGPFQYKMLRPKFMVDKLVPFPKNHVRTNKDLVALIFVAVDDVGAAYNAFALTDPGKDGNGVPTTLKTWEAKVLEARMTYDLGVIYAKNPPRDSSEKEFSSDVGMLLKQASEELSLEREVRERVATMLHRNMGASTEHTDAAAAALAAVAAEIAEGIDSGKGKRHPNLQNMRLLQRTSTGGSSRTSRLSSFQQSLSVTSHEDSHAGPSRVMSLSQPAELTTTTHVIPIQPDEDSVSSITVNIVSETESESQTTIQSALGPDALQVPLTPSSQLSSSPQLSPSPRLSLSPQMSPSPQRSSSGQRSPTPRRSPTPQRAPALQRSQTPVPPVVVLEQSSPHRASPARSVSTGHTLRVTPQSGMMSFMHSLPDLSVDSMPSTSRSSQTPFPQSVSEKLYQSHQELLQRNRLAAQQQYLSPDHRGASYPPPSPTRASLKRGLAFSYSFKYPPLHKMGHVHSQSQQLSDLGPSTTPIKSKESQAESQSSKVEKKSLLNAASSFFSAGGWPSKFEGQLKRLFFSRGKDKSKSKEQKSAEKEMEKAMLEVEKFEKEELKEPQIVIEIEREEENQCKDDSTQHISEQVDADDKQDKKVECSDGKDETKTKDKGKGKGKRSSRSKDRNGEKSKSQEKDESKDKDMKEVKDESKDKDEKEVRDDGQSKDKKQATSREIEQDSSSSTSSSEDERAARSA